MLESQIWTEDNPNQLTSTCPKKCDAPATSENVLKVHVAGATLKGRIPAGTKSFILIDFHTFGSELSNVVPGTSPEYNFTATYELEVDRFLLHTMVKG